MLFQKNNRKIAIILVSSFAFIFILGFIGVLIFKKNENNRISESKQNETVLTYWGITYPPEVMNPIIDKYERQHPNVKIEYVKKEFSNLERYKTFLKSRLKTGSGPDIFRVHSTWIPEFMPEISSSNTVMSRGEFEQLFYPVARTQCVTTTGVVLCVPLMYDGIVLLYNKPMFLAAAVSTPKTWEDLRDTAKKLVNRLNSNGSYIGGVSLGTASNVSNSTDILGLMFVQSDLEIPADLDSDSAAAALDLYTDFTKKDNVWSANMPNSVFAFATQKVAMVFAKSTDIKKILEINPTLDFGVLDVPQLPDLDGGFTNKHWASFWVETVSNDISQRKQQEAWRFLEWMAQTDQQMALNNELSKYSKITEIPANKNLSGDFSGDRYLNVIARGASTASTNIIADGVGNDEYADLLKNAITSVVNGKVNSKEVLKDAKEKYLLLVRNRYSGYSGKK